MESYVKHLRWYGPVEEDGTQLSGMVAVAVKPSKLVISQLFGKALPVEILPEVLAVALTAEAVNTANAAHMERVNPFSVQVRVGMSGSRDFLLRPLQDEETWDTPIKGGIHVSMYDKLNERVELWLGDLPPLLAAMSRDGCFRLREDQVDWYSHEGVSGAEARIRIEEVPLYEGSFHAPKEAISFGDFGVQIEEVGPPESFPLDRKYLSPETLERLRQIQFDEDDEYEDEDDNEV